MAFGLSLARAFRSALRTSLPTLAPPPLPPDSEFSRGAVSEGGS